MSGANKHLLTLRALFIAMASIQLVTAASGTLVALYFAETGASQEVAALAPALYSIGFLLGCFHIAGWIGRIGHIRSFAAGAAVCVASVLLFSLTELLVPLLIVRFTAGLATAGLFAIGDAWISQSANEANRGRLLATYAIVLGTMSFGSQMTIQFLPDDLDDAFVVISLLYCLAIVVLTAARINPPAAHTDASVRILALFKDSPTAWIGSFTVGMVATTLLNLSPYRAAAQGVDPKDIALALGALYLGRIIFMYPLGRASDRYDCYSDQRDSRRSYSSIFVSRRRGRWLAIQSDPRNRSAADTSRIVRSTWRCIAHDVLGSGGTCYGPNSARVCRIGFSHDAIRMDTRWRDGTSAGKSDLSCIWGRRRELAARLADN